MKSLYDLVGMKFMGRCTEAFVRNQPDGATAKLVRDPLNVHDRNAVQVWLGGERVGFVKATQAAGLARKMDGAGQSQIVGRLVAAEWPRIEVEE